MKISKESIAGLVAAVELFVKRDYTLQLNEWEGMSLRIYKSLENNKSVIIRTGYPAGPGVQPVCILRVYIKPLKMTAADLQHKLLTSPTPVYVDVLKDEIVINPQCLEPEELEPLIGFLKQALS